MNFHRLSQEEKRLIFEELASKTNLPPYAIEKDWWVVQTLRLVYQLDVSEYLLFKGGTSLSKGWGLIERFSEDIDLALERSYFGFEKEITRSLIKHLRKQSQKYLSEQFFSELKHLFSEAGLPEVTFQLGEIATEDQDPVQIEIYYPSVTDQSTYIPNRVFLEISCRSLKEPFSNRTIQSIVSENFPDRPFSDKAIEVPTVGVRRTFLEKLFLLHEEFQRPADKIRSGNRLSRHLYDIYQLIKTEHADLALDDPILFKTIVQHRKKFARMGGVNYDSHFPPNLNPIPPDEIKTEWKADYERMQNEMIYGESPSYDEMITSIKSRIDQFNKTSK